MKRLLYTALILGFSGMFAGNLVQAQEKVQFKAPDKVTITADLYAPNPASSPLIILFHQAKYSRGEFIEIAPKLNEMGFNCLAVDLRSGESANGVRNETYWYADSLHKKTRYTDAYPDMVKTISYAKSKFSSSKIILLGSSYSASLALKLAGDYPQHISGVAAFSPGEYFAVYGWARDIIKISSSRIKCPVFITSAQGEAFEWEAIYDAIPTKTKVSFVPEASGKHGAKALWSTFPESKEYWSALSKFLTQFK